MRTLVIALVALCLMRPDCLAAQASWTLQEISPRLYAAIAAPASAATSNAFVYIGRSYVVAGGAHMTEIATRDLYAAIAERTDLPVRYFVLPHHHPGYTSVDFSLPPATDVVMTYPVWKALRQEVAPFPNQALLYSEGLTLKIDGRSLVLTNMGHAHSDGDSLVYFPEEKALFTSDLLYVESVGYLGEGNMENWVLALEFMRQLEVKTVIPGHGPVSGTKAIDDFRDFFKNFLSEVIRHIEAGDSLEKTRKEFTLPRYRHYQGFDQLLELNIERAYRNLQATVLKK